jgi:hypothetical protein
MSCEGVVASCCTLTRPALVADRHSSRPDMPRHNVMPYPRYRLKIPPTRPSAASHSGQVRDMYFGRFTDGPGGLRPAILPVSPLVASPSVAIDWICAFEVWHVVLEWQVGKLQPARCTAARLVAQNAKEW